MSNQNTYQASCFCGDVEITLHGDAEAMAYCHCDSCRRWSAGPLSAFTLWKPENIEINKGKGKLQGYTGNPGSNHNGVVSDRKWCKNCGGHVFTDHPTMGLVDVPSAVIKSFEFTPGFHVHYQESVHHVTDDLPKFKDLPAEAGGTGETMDNR